jgi:NADPH:quinone reductase-like Zn-dependent oxidoreductase
MSATGEMAIPSAMRAVRFYKFGGPEVLQVEEVPVPEPGPGEVLIRVRAAGISGWDLRARAGRAPQLPGRPPLTLPFQPGREGSGEVAAVGSGVDALVVGDRVVLLPNPSCGRCHYCTKRDTHMCVMRQLPGHSVMGACAEYVVAAAEAVLRTPETVDDVQACTVVWAYGTALHMLEKGEMRVGDSVLVTAASSSMGIACLQLAKLAGAGVVIGLTRAESKHQALIANGADVVLDHRDPSTPGEIRRLIGAVGVDLVLDNYGSQELIDFASDAIDLGGRLVLIASEAAGVDDTVSVSPLRMIGKEMSVLGSRGATRREQEVALQLAARGQVWMPIAEIIPFSEVRRGHELQAACAHVGKIVLSV